ncbi:hypothetical protein Val02_32570 [Virgisporangium aliadipatigenens]|uniref:ATP-binding protein n=1 Tax=Virgisporangium aliadipatigenens TaxID=741659 RepID=A0A8J3YM38_9ACTN|nr:hypothetical protein Val02_32570 [Virgisporangium aliadipatigenens]
MFRDALDDAGQTIAAIFLHGPGGIGKSALLQRYADEARDRGRTVVELDGRAISPTPAAFREAAGDALTDDRTVLLVDGFEHCQGLELWLRDRFLPRLPVGVLVVLAGRRPPDLGWQSDAGWAEALCVLRLTELDRDDAVELLERRDVPAEAHKPVLRFTSGHPLALCLAAESAGRSGTWSPDRYMVETLLARMVGEPPSAAHRRALEVCAHAHTTTEDLLRSVLPDDAGTLFAWLRRLPFIDSGRHGLFPTGAAREAIDTDLRWRDPHGYRALHDTIRSHVIERIRDAPEAGVLPAATAFCYLNRRGGVISRFITYTRIGEFVECRYLPEDRADVLRLALSAEGPASAALVEFWLERQPEGFWVHKRADTGEVVGFMGQLRSAHCSTEELSADPVVAAAWAHCRAAGPVRSGETITITRFLVAAGSYMRPSPVMDMMLWRVVAGWVRDERVAWSFAAMADPEYWEPLMAYTDQQLVQRCRPEVGGRAYGIFAHDWRVTPPDRWLAVGALQALFGPRAMPKIGAGLELTVLARGEFDTAVRDALRAWRQPDLLATNPLARSRLVTDQADGSPAERLRAALNEAVDGMRDDPREAKLHRAVVATYRQGAPTQEAAAERLGLPFSTYRRHLAAGVERICERLWDRELRGPASEAGS